MENKEPFHQYEITGNNNTMKIFCSYSYFWLERSREGQVSS